MLEFCVVAFISTLGAFVFSDVIMNFLRWLMWILGYHLEQGDRVLVSGVGLGVVSHALNPELVSDSEDIYVVKIDKCDEYYIGAFKFYQIHRIYRRGEDNA